MAGYVTNNPTELKDAILRRLGAPIIQVELSEDQIYDCIQRALELYGEYHFDGVNKAYKVFNVDAEQAKHGVFDLKDSGIFAVTKIIRTNMGLTTTMDGSAVYPWVSDFVLGLTGAGGSIGAGCSSRLLGFGGELSYLSQLMSYQTTMQDMISPLPEFWFNSANGQLKIIGNFNAGDVIVVEVYVKSYIDVPDMIGGVAGYAHAGGCSIVGGVDDIYNNPINGVSGVVAGMGSIKDSQQGAYNNRWVKDYAHALCKELNGQILAKHQGLQLAGGVTIDGTRLIEEARIDIEKLREELYLLDPPSNIIIM